MSMSLYVALTVCLLIFGTNATMAQDEDRATDARVIELEAD
jgi:hypothetical protein